jgi:hypothetical protein
MDEARDVESRFGPQSLRFIQLCDIFGREVLERVLARPGWAERYPQVLASIRSSDPLVRDRAIVPAEMVRELAQRCDLDSDLYADGDTLLVVPPGKAPTRVVFRENEPTQVEGIAVIEGAVQLTPAAAIEEFGVDALWLAFEYGFSRRGEQALGYRRNLPPEPRHVAFVEVASSGPVRCGSCAADWSAGLFGADCPECGGGALETPCRLCGGRCGGTWRKAIVDTPDFGQAHWSGTCLLPPEEQEALYGEPRDPSPS